MIVPDIHFDIESLVEGNKLDAPPEKSLKAVVEIGCVKSYSKNNDE